MNFRQFRYVDEAVRRDLNLTEVAAALRTSQSGVSKQINDFEDELSISLFVRRGKRFVALTEAGEGVVPLIQKVAHDVDKLLDVAERYAKNEGGRLVIATTHAQARYTLPAAIEKFRGTHPGVEIILRQASPRQVAEMIVQGDADVGIATEALGAEPAINTLASYSWRHVVAVHRNHPLASRTDLSLADLAEFPIITYDKEFSARSHIDQAFEQAGLTPEIVLTALDADVIKAYVEIDLGVGILAEMAVDSKRRRPCDKDIVVFDVPGMFQTNVTQIGVRKGAFFRAYVYRFIETLLPDLAADDIRNQLGKPVDEADTDLEVRDR